MEAVRRLDETFWGVWTALAPTRQRANLRRTTRIALVVGTILTVINRRT